MRTRRITHIRLGYSGDRGAHIIYQTVLKPTANDCSEGRTSHIHRHFLYRSQTSLLAVVNSHLEITDKYASSGGDFQIHVVKFANYVSGVVSHLIINFKICCQL